MIRANSWITVLCGSYRWELLRCLSPQQASWLAPVNQKNQVSWRTSSHRSLQAPADPRCSHLRHTPFPGLQTHINTSMFNIHQHLKENSCEHQTLTCADKRVVSPASHQLNFLRLQGWNITKKFKTMGTVTCRAQLTSSSFDKRFVKQNKPNTCKTQEKSAF